MSAKFAASVRPPILAQTEYWLLADKPTGLATHRTESHSGDGYVEWLSRQLAMPLYIVHRLDKDTSGCLLLAKTPEAAKTLTDVFTQREIRKTYLLVTDRESTLPDRFVHQSQIQREGSEWISEADAVSGAKAETEFEKVSERGAFTLWRAYPKTGRTHQIRLHARDCGIPILGDVRYGGTPFARLMLHSQTLDWENLPPSPLPFGFEQLAFLERPRLMLWLSALDRRQRLYSEALDPRQTLRLIHQDGNPLWCDRLGSVLWFLWKTESPPHPSDLEDVKSFSEIAGCESWSLQWRSTRGHATPRVEVIESTPPPPSDWVANEGEKSFYFSKSSGISPGLFLDQRANRRWVENESKDRRVLNLFAYTGGFSVFAASGGASKVVSVDLSKSYLEWTRRNLELNGFDPKASQFEYWSIDTFDYLSLAQKKRWLFDLVICDPPSFSRNQKKVFRIERDWSDLLEKILQLLSPEGQILFSNNSEKWDLKIWSDKLQAFARAHRLTILPAPQRDFDFEGPRHPPTMKCFLLTRE